MKKRILILAANPRETSELRLEDEVRAITQGLERSQNRDDLVWKTELAPTHHDIRRAMLKLHPHIVHFCGHGMGKEGLLIENQFGEAHFVDAGALADFFKLFTTVECVVLNACYSEIQAKAIAKHIKYVVGMRRRIRNDAALEFAVAFYDAIGVGGAFEFAYELGRNAIQMAGVSGHLTPVFLSRCHKTSESDQINDHKQLFQQEKSSVKISESEQHDFRACNALSSNQEGEDGTYSIKSQKVLQGEEKFDNINSSNFSIIDSPIHLELIRIPAGKFWMGSDPERDSYAIFDELPQHEVYLSEFYIGRYPVNNEQYAEFVQAQKIISPKGWPDKNGPHDKIKHPVVYIIWKEAIAFCEWLTQKTGTYFCLPTEAEWEKAARGTERNIYPWGNDWDGKRLNWSKNGRRTTTPVGDFSPFGDSPYGVADMCGNEYEWCSDWYESNLYQQRVDIDIVKNPRGPEHGPGRVIRGGAFKDGQKNVRCAHRNYRDPLKRFENIGFRVVMRKKQ